MHPAAVEIALRTARIYETLANTSTWPTSPLPPPATGKKLFALQLVFAARRDVMVEFPRERYAEHVDAAFEVVRTQAATLVNAIDWGGPDAQAQMVEGLRRAVRAAVA